MKKLSRLTALLLAIVMLLSTTAIAEDGFPQSEFNLQRYNQMHTDVQQRGLIDSAYEHYVQELAKLDTAARYAKLVSWHDNGLLGDIFYDRFISYYKTAHPDGTLICTCAAPLPYGGEGHADGCPWHIDSVNGRTTVKNVIEGVEVAVTGAIPEGATLQLIPTATDVSVESMFTTDQKILFSADISVLNADGSKWQPASGEKATVKINAAPLGLKDGDGFFVLHYLDDGAVECIEDVQIIGDIVSFVTSSFSGFDVVQGSTATIKNVSSYFDVTGKSGNNHYNVKGIYFDKDGIAYMLLEGKSGNSPSKSLTSITLKYIADNRLVTKTISDPSYTAASGINTINLVDSSGNPVDEVNSSSGSKTWYWSIGLGNEIEVTDVFTLTVDFGENGFDISGQEYTVTLNYNITKEVLSVEGKEPIGDSGSAITGYDTDGNPVYSTVKTAIVEPGETVVYEVTISNGTDSNITLSNAVISDILPTLPSGFSFTSVKYGESRDSINIDASNNGTIILKEDLELTPGSSKTYFVQVEYPTGLATTVEQVFTNTATISGDNLVTHSDSAYVEIPPIKKGSLVINKTVNKEGFTGGTFTFNVIGEGYEQQHSIVIPKGETTGSFTIPDLLAGDYTVTETSRDGYTVTGEATVKVPAGDSVTVNVINTACEKTSVEAKKTWVDNNDALKLRPDDVTLTLYANGTAVEGTPTVAKDGNEWTYTWTNVEKYDTAGNLIKYTVGEQTVPTYYEKNEDGLTVTNTLTAGKLIITKEVKKSDYSGQTFSFTVNGQTQEITVPKAESGSVHTASGDAIILTQGTYLVSETEESKDGYSVTGEGNVEVKPGEVATITITNTATGDTNVTATKVWADNNNELGLRSEALTLKVSGNNKEYVASSYIVDANDENKWLYTFEVPKYDADGNVITYTADEVDVPENYQKTTNGLTVTNELTAGKLMINKTVKKEDYVAETFTFTVDAKPYSITVPATAGSTVHCGSLENAIVLPAGTYTVTETGAANYSTTMQNGTATAVSDKTIEVTITAGQTTTVNVVNTASEQIELSVSKEWEDNENMWNLRPESVSIELNGKVGVTAFAHGKDALTLTAADGWSGSWQNVPKYDGEGRLITYTVTEAAAAKYTSSVTDNEAPEFVVTNTLNTYDLTIRKAGLDLNLDPHSSTMYQVVGENGIAVDMTVAIHGNSSVTIKNLPQGIYTVNELTDWSWRYSSSSNRTNDQVDVDGTDDTITFTNTRNEIYWLDSDCYAENRFTGSGAVATINPTK